MPGVITTCAECAAEFSWNTDFQEMPDCPRCGYNPRRRFQQSDVPSLVGMLESGDMYVSSNAAEELGKRDDRQAVEPLIAALKDGGPKLAAVIALGKIADAKAVEPLIAVLKEGQGPSGSAAWALVRIGSTDAIQAVAESMEHIDARALDDVFEAFESNGKSSVPVLIPMLESEDKFVRRGARRVLARLGWHPEGQAEQISFYLQAGMIAKLAEAGADAVETLVGRLKDDDSVVRVWAAQALGEIKDARAVEPLIAALQNCDSDFVRREVATALMALGAIKDLRVMRSLINMLADEQAQNRLFAAKALSAIGTPAIFVLVAALKSRDERIRRYATGALGELADSRAVEPLLSRLHDSEDSIRMLCAESLGMIGDARAVEPLIAALKDRVSDVRSLAAEALGKIGDPRAVKELETLHKIARKDKDWATARAAQDALAQITGRRPNENESFRDRLMGFVRSLLSGRKG